MCQDWGGIETILRWRRSCGHCSQGANHRCGGVCSRLATDESDLGTAVRADFAPKYGPHRKSLEKHLQIDPRWNKDARFSSSYSGEGQQERHCARRSEKASSSQMGIRGDCHLSARDSVLQRYSAVVVADGNLV